MKREDRNTRKEETEKRASKANDGTIRYVLTVYKADGTFQRIQMTNVVSEGIKKSNNHLFDDICTDLHGIRWEVESFK